MPPEGPDGAQGGRTAAEEDAPRDVGDASDQRSEAPGEADGTEAVGKPEAGSVAPGDPAPAPKASTAGTKKASVAKSAEANADAAATKPKTLDAPEGGAADDLKMIKGIGPKLEALVNKMGFYHFSQIADWGPNEVSWVDQNLEGFKGRVTRDNWVEQAKKLAAGEETEFSSRATKDGIYNT